MSKYALAIGCREGEEKDEEKREGSEPPLNPYISPPGDYTSVLALNLNRRKRSRLAVRVST